MTPLVQVRDLRVGFPARGGLLPRRVTVVDGVSFDIGRGRTLGLVGESGSGKSTIARAMLRLIPATGSVTLDGTDLMTLRPRALRRIRRHAQMVFQDPFSSINPAMVVGEVIAEPLRVHQRLDRAGRDRRVTELLDLVGLPVAYRERYAHEFSGGQRQRVAIARALATSPSLVVCDEAVSALDVSTQNQIVGLLADLSAELGLSYLFISHGLAVVGHLADDVAVLYGGRVVETGPAERVYRAPAHPYTASLLAASPVPDPRRQRARRAGIAAAVAGDPPDPALRGDGCVFTDRCPMAADLCRAQAPPPVPVAGGGLASCHFPLKGT
ncbi:ABC transporter ATP-binding protein [Spirillospora sp. CA-255316]